MRTKNKLDALFPKTRQAILGAVLIEPERWWYRRELAHHLRVTPSTLQRELDSLVAGGLLRQKREGKHVYLQAATDSPIFTELRSLILKTVGLADVIRDALRPLRKRIHWAFIYGSIARAEEHAASDVDLMIIGRAGLADVSSPLRKAELKLGRVVNPTVYTPEDFGSKVKAGQHFLTTLLRAPRLFVLGDAREFENAFGK